MTSSLVRNLVVLLQGEGQGTRMRTLSNPQATLRKVRSTVVSLSGKVQETRNLRTIPCLGDITMIMDSLREFVIDTDPLRDLFSQPVA